MNHPGVKIQSNTPKCAKTTIKISASDRIIALIGPNFIPIELSSKNLINPAPPKGIGAVPLLLFFLLDWVRLDDIFNSKSFLL
jgi:hypothetical protein